MIRNIKTIVVFVLLLMPIASLQGKGKYARASNYYSSPRIDMNDVKAYLDSIGVKHSEIVLRQAVYESANFTYKPLMQKNNIFGFRHAHHYLRYKSWRACADYYKKWQDRHYKDNTEDYYDFLIRIKYATSKVYIAHLKKVKLDLKR